MKIVNFKGGLGNQISIYLFCLYLKRHCPNERICGAYWSKTLREHTDFQLEKVFDITLPPRSLLTDFISKAAYWMETRGLVSTEEGSHSVFFNGVWLDKMYWDELPPASALRFRPVSLSARNEEYKRQIAAAQSVSVHIRRGDYQQGRNKECFGAFCTLDYYRAAIAEMSRSGEPLRFFVFSDDVEWVRKNLPIDNAVYVTGNEGNDSWLDLFLMSLCRHNIIANSTFSFWAAMLNANPSKRVFYPRRWYIWDNPDIFPADWKAL